MGTILAVLTQKGGAGKSTVCTNLAVELINRGYSVVIIETDPQRTASKWNAMRAADLRIPIVQVLEPSLIKVNAQAQAKAFDVVLIDGAAVVEEPMVESIKVADAVVMPCPPALRDLWGVVAAADLVKTRQSVTEGRPMAAFVVNKAEKGRVLTRQIDEKLMEMELPIFDTKIRYLEVFKIVDETGVAVCEYEPNGAADKDIKRLAEEMFEHGFLIGKKQ
jgi:chromosome partitioning protein